VDFRNRMRLLVVDDHEVVRTGLSQFLYGDETEVVGTAGTAPEALVHIETLSPDAVLMDVRMEEFDGLWALEQIRVGYPDLPVVFLSSYDNPTYMARAIALGVNDYLLKNASRDCIIDALRRGVDKLPTASNSALQRVRQNMELSRHVPDGLPDFSLTNREIQVLRHIGLGLSNKEIAKSLRISVETVKEHVQNILRKTKATDRTDAAVKAVRWGLVE
jgi:DNA-binding NarL/FixJ family response regulator